MREIKFRAWDKIRKVWLKDDEFNINSNGIISLEFKCDSKQESDVILVQFTGLKDKNGKEIFEGDIIKDKYNQVWKIEFDRGCFIGFGGERELFHIFAMDEPEVIGNIYENSELLEEQERK